MAQHWARRLPEVGDELLAKAAEIEALDAEIALLQERRVNAESYALMLAGRNWSYDEIMAAGGEVFVKPEFG